MSITVYTGVVGSGKTYEAVKTVLLPAVASGRRVVTNISGINKEKIYEYLKSQGRDSSLFSDIIVVSNERIVEPDFFCGEPEPEFKFPVPDWIPLKQLQAFGDNYPMVTGKRFGSTAFQLLLPQLKLLQNAGYDLGSCLLMAVERGWKSLPIDYFQSMPTGEPFAFLPEAAESVVQGGDLVILDECWRFWSDSNTLPAEHMNFVRMHRHYLSDDGVSCDLLIMIQDFPSLNKFIRGVCELVLKFSKLKSLGLSQRYRVDIFDGRPSKATLVSTSPWQKYDKSIFPLYKSYDGNGGTEKRTDDRQNLFANPYFLTTMILAPVLLMYFGYTFYKWIQKTQHPERESKAGVTLASSPANSEIKPGSTPVSKFSSTSKASEVIRLVSVLESNRGDLLVIIQDANGHYIQKRMQSGVVDGWLSTVGHEGSIAAFDLGGRKK